MMGNKGLWVAAFAAVVATVSADDGMLSWGGSPNLLHGKTKVRMISEDVKLKVTVGSHNKVAVDCSFVFENEGPSCDVRIGFPDKGSGAVGSGYGEEADKAAQAHKKVPPFTGLVGFRSWVDGVQVKTTVMDASSPDNVASWHVKSVHFGAHQKHVIRDTYTQVLGGGATSTPLNQNSTVFIYEGAYEMDTGGSWYQNIEDAKVTVELPFKVSSAAMLQTTSAYELKDWNTVKAGQVRCQGFAAPVASGNRLVFEAKNLKPDKASDIHVYWPLQPGQQFGQ